MPLVIPLLQRQQSRLHYYCAAENIPSQSSFSKPIRLVYDAAEYAASALSSDSVTAELAKWAEVHDWMEDAGKTFFGSSHISNDTDFVFEVQFYLNGGREAKSNDT